MPRPRRRPPTLDPSIGLEEFRETYWMKADLVRFLRELGLPTDGAKPELEARIERRIRGEPEPPRCRRSAVSGRDSDRPLTRETPVVNDKSDAATRAFFRREIGPEFHFTWHVNQFRQRHEGLTYGDLVDEWRAERDRRRDPSYRARLARHGKWNRFVRDFFADPANRGRTIADAAARWRVVKETPGDHRYRPRREE